MNSVERAAPEPSQGGSSLEAKLDEQDRLNVPRLLLNDAHSLPQLGFGVWQIPDATQDSVRSCSLPVVSARHDTRRERPPSVICA
jgi:hypothetical protein